MTWYRVLPIAMKILHMNERSHSLVAGLMETGLATGVPEVPSQSNFLGRTALRGSGATSKGQSTTVRYRMENHEFEHVGMPR